MTTETAEACLAALQRILHCNDRCWHPHTRRGRVPGGGCLPGRGGRWNVYSPCDDGEGYCPAPDCVYYGQCLCPCHFGQREDS